MTNGLSTKVNKWIKIGVIVVIVLIIGLWLKGLFNQENDLRNLFNAKMSGRTSFYDKMWKTLNQKGQIALKNDSSFYRNVQAIMDARADAQGQFMNWVQESNPNANYSEVSALYKDLSRAVEAQRDEFNEREVMLQDIKMQHDNLLGRFPGNIGFMILGKKNLEYKPITSDRTDEVIKTGKDNDVKVF